MGLMDYYTGPSGFAGGLNSFATNAFNAYSQVRNMNLNEDKLAEERRQADMMQQLRQAQIAQIMEQNQMAQLERQKATGLQQDLQQYQANAGNMVETGPGGGAKYGNPADAPGQLAQILSRYDPKAGVALMIENQRTQPQSNLWRAQAGKADAETSSVLGMMGPNQAKTGAEAGKLEAERGTELKKIGLMDSQSRYYGAEADKAAAQTKNISGEQAKNHNTIAGLNSLFTDMDIPLIEVNPNEPVDANFITEALRARLSFMGVKEAAGSRERVAGDKDEKTLLVQAVNLAKSQLSTLTAQIDKLEGETGGVNALLDEAGTLAKRRSLAVLKGEYEKKLRETEAMSSAALKMYGLKIDTTDITKPISTEPPAGGGSPVWQKSPSGSLIFTGKPGAR